MCKLNPVSEELVGLRFRSLSFLVDVCGEDVTPYSRLRGVIPRSPIDLNY
ncbi:Mo-dependent nitrogenase C-terminal domain-containing protein [Microcoleus sp. LAD1_D5]